MKKKIAILSIGMMPLMALHAQQDTTLVRTVVVENEYNPIVMDASKINVLPKVEEPAVPKTHIDYATSSRSMARWNYETMQPMVRDWQADAPRRGYLHAGYGNRGNVDAGLGYLWDISKKDRLNMEASFNGWNGEREGLNDATWNSRMYQVKVGADYEHAFKSVDFTLGGDFQSKVYNSLIATKQHQTLADVYVGLASSEWGKPIQFTSEVGWKYFKQKYPIHLHESGETNLYAQANVWKLRNEEERYGMAVRFDNYAYTFSEMEDAFALDLNPYYILRNDDWSVRLGAHIDWWGGDDSKLYVAPDVNVSYRLADKYVLFAKAGGGRQTYGLYELSHVSPYWSGNRIVPTYVTLDAALGLKASPVNGLWFHVSGGYQIREKDLCLCFFLEEEPPYRVMNDVMGGTKVFYGTAELKYDYKDLFDISLKGTCYNWKWNDAEDGELPLSLKPELELDARMGAKVMEGLKAHIGYEYVKRCNEVSGDPVNNLYLGADYALLKNVNLFARVNNLLNKEYVGADAYPAQKLNFLAGLSLQF